MTSIYISYVSVCLSVRLSVCHLDASCEKFIYITYHSDCEKTHVTASIL